MKNGMIESAGGTKEWWVNDQRHREDGPAIEYDDGTKAWFANNQSHREDGPAVEYPNGDKVWCLNGQVLIPASAVDWVSTKDKDKPSPGDLIRRKDRLLLVTTVLGDADQGYQLAFLE